MALYVISDLHLHDEEQEFLFSERKQAIFQALAAEIILRRGELLLAGDTFDLTGMAPPARGLARFFNGLSPHARIEPAVLRRALEMRSISARMRALSARYRGFFEALTELAAQDRLIVIPGNHDCALHSDVGRRAFELALGEAGSRVRWTTARKYGDFVFTLHGNEFDEANRTDHGCANRGRVITEALYRGIMPALRALKVPEEVVAAIPAVRPEEEIVRGIEHYLGEKEARKLLIGFVRLLEDNGYFRGVQKSMIWLVTHELPPVSSLARALVTPERMRKALPDDSKLKHMARAGAGTLRGGSQVVVMGHTHELDFGEGYVNLGTWIDHVSGLSPEHLKAPDRRLPVLRARLEDQSAALWDAQGLERGLSLEACPVLWKRETVIAA
jgi:UDP-2,3-diacylglucosamine pyrophosphatase LpxH